MYKCNLNHSSIYNKIYDEGNKTGIFERDSISYLQKNSDVSPYHKGRFADTFYIFGKCLLNMFFRRYQG